MLCRRHTVWWWWSSELFVQISKVTSEHQCQQALDAEAKRHASRFVHEDRHVTSMQHKLQILSDQQQAAISSKVCCSSFLHFCIHSVMYFMSIIVVILFLLHNCLCNYVEILSLFCVLSRANSLPFPTLPLTSSLLLSSSIFFFPVDIRFWNICRRFGGLLFQWGLCSSTRAALFARFCGFP